MKITPKFQTRMYQMGGAMPEEAPMEEAPVEGGMPAEEGAPAEDGEQDPMMMLMQVAAQALQAQDCQAAMQVCQALLELGQQIGGNVPEEQLGEPVFARNGCKVIRRIKKRANSSRIK